MTHGECALNVEPAHFRHMQIEHQTVRLVILDRVQKLGAGRERLDREAGRRNESLQGKSNVCIVVHYGQ
jgi:hypothetical protein